MTNELFKELLSFNNNALKTLNEGFFFDFENELHIFRFDGKFTHNSIKKMINMDLDLFTVCLLVKNVKYWESSLVLIPMYENGFGLEPQNKMKYNHAIRTLYTKKQIDEIRKEEQITTYVLFQRNTMLKKKNYEKIDTSERYKLINKIGLSDGMGRHGISQFDIISRSSGKKFNVKTEHGFSSCDINYYIDKSGYLVEEKKEELKRRAKVLRAEREKEKADNFDFSEHTKTLKEINEALRKMIDLRFSMTRNYDEISDFKCLLGKYQWLLLDIERYFSCVENKKFSSISNEQEKYERIIKNANEILKGGK